MRWIGYTAGALIGAFLLNLAAFSMLLYGLEYHASSFRHAVAYVGGVILYPGIAPLPGKDRPIRYGAPLLGEF